MDDEVPIVFGKESHRANHAAIRPGQFLTRGLISTLPDPNNTFTASSLFKGRKCSHNDFIVYTKDHNMTGTFQSWQHVSNCFVRCGIHIFAIQANNILFWHLDVLAQAIYLSLNTYRWHWARRRQL